MKKITFHGAIKLCMLAMMALCFVRVAVGQVEQGRFVGRIADPSDSVVPGATVKVTNMGTNITQTAVTNESGEFVITPVQAGIYSLSITAAGFETTTASNIEVQVGQIVREDMKLRIGASNISVEVTTAAALLSTDSATIGQVITNKQLTELPLNGRGFFKLAQLTPGAALLAPTGNSLAIRPEVVDGNTISGIRGSATSFLLDGVDVSEQHQGGTFIQTSIDALQEFSVTQSPYSAEYNRGGAFFNATTKGGTNRFHGGVFEFIRNDKLDARNYFALTRQILKRNQFGVNLGGPISVPHLYDGKDRTFFFVNYEGQRLRQGLIFNSIVANSAQRTGNFGTKTIYDPLLTTTVGGTVVRVPFANNTIPTNRLSPQALAIQAYVPQVNTTTGTFSNTPSQAIDFDQFIVRLDHQINATNRLFARWVYVDNRETDPNASPQLGKASLTSIGQDIALGVITNIGANKVNEARVHYLPSHVRLTAFLQGTDYNTKFGVAGFAAQTRPGSGGSFPDYSWSGYASLQGSAFDQRPKSQDRKAVEGTDNFTYLRGRQSLKAGVFFRYYQWLGYDSQTYAGQFSFNGNASGDAYADFLLGYPSSVARAYPADNFGGQATYKQFYFQDDIRLTSKLTINAGLRYEYSPWLGGYKGQIGTFDPTQAKPIIVSGPGAVPDLTAQYAAPAAYQFFGQYIQTSSQAKLPSNITYTDKTQFGPRLGVSYALTSKTIVRGGFGMFYEPEGTSGRVNLNTLPYRLAETVNQTQNVVPTRTLANFFLGTALGSAQANPTLNPSKTRLKMGYNEHYSFGIQQQLSKKDVFEVGYVGNRGVHLNGSNDFNDPTPGAGSIQARRPYQPWGTIGFNTQDTSTSYHSLQMKIDHRASHGLSGLVSYTYSKFMQFNQSPALGGNTGYEYAVSPYDVPHNVAASGSYEIPVGRGRHFLNHSNTLVNSVLGGWQIQTIIVVRSGVPFTAVISGDRANTGVGGQRPNLNPAGGNPAFVKSVATWFDKSKYVVAPLYTYGQVRANTLRTDKVRQYDASIFKNFAMPRESTLSFRAEFFNVSNTTSFNAPNSTIDATAGGQITSTSVPSRDIQFALKYNF
ncbi:Carboxypeptidase regulatory-like domain-containing protein [Granulicella pectinivorans]|uniref:Carboxypeptidase regulatory-like domain-containing protein n=1 Tax=Granulicella pectinivorans TaxID=474950 RepID=A0A1I6LV02_9BACT|nr:carboxypeptidase-like regulatory domain-containing protein [Granulicella pectinivorans]SFS07238.1 Carboxypeptidase regulatory-like domain-containing protein [Granulicella pectinivorans]